MFDPAPYDQLREAAASLADARSSTGLATANQLCDAARALQQAHDILDGLQADVLARIEDTRAFEDEGASTVVTWMTRELRIPATHARRRVKAGHTLRTLPPAAKALIRGEIRLTHVHELTAGITKAGTQTMVDAQDLLMPVATTADPSALRRTIDHLVDVVHPEALDDAWSKGMDRRDVQLARCGDGYHVSGFLDIVTGAKLHAYLRAASAGDGPDDTRTPAVRRVDALGRAVDNAGDGAAPGHGARGGIRPHVYVLAELETLLGTPGADTATLAGFGPIGRDLLGYLTCAGETTSVLTDGHTNGPTPQARVLNVGRTARLATSRQRHAVIARQGGHCAAPACTNTQLEIHHVAWWSRDAGATDLSNLVGLCSTCHHLTHRQKLTIECDGSGGFTFRRARGSRIDDHARRTRHRIRVALRRILRETTDSRSTERPTSPRRLRRPDDRSRGCSIGEGQLDTLVRQHRPPMRT